MKTKQNLEDIKKYLLWLQEKEHTVDLSLKVVFTEFKEFQIQKVVEGFTHLQQQLQYFLL